MKHLSLLIVLLVAGSPALNAQVEVTGMVVGSEELQPLDGALVTVGSSRGVYTNEDGSFSLRLPEGDHRLSVKYLGYEALELDISTSRPELGTILLTRSHTTLDEVVVSASPQNFRKEFKGSNFRINPVTLNKINALNTEEVLRTVPGVNIVGDMGLSNRPNISIRGSWGRRSKKVLLMEDGTPSAPAPYIAPGAYYNPVSERITSVEVYKGADMLRFGPNNMYGAINYITALPPPRPELRVKLIGGQRQYRTGLLSYGGTWNNLGALVEGVYKSFDGFTDNSSVEILNLNAKIFAKLADDQSLYFKVSGQFEDNQASLSSQTPFTFETDPGQNPLDADQFTMRRYGVDIIHKWLPAPRMSVTSKLYASDFERDWWRQITVKIPASEVRDYVGAEIFNDRYQYLEGRTFDPEDYVIAGRVLNGREGTSDSRWTYTVAGIKEAMNLDWEALGGTHQLEVSGNLHRETFKDMFLVADSTRWARHGTTVTDLRYRLWSFNGFIRNAFNFGSWGITPILRYEYVDMYRHDLIALAQDPALSGTKEGREVNTYNQLLPGITLDYQHGGMEFFGSIYEGMIAPSKVFGFLVEQNGIVTNPLQGESINIEPELSWNREVGWRGSLFDKRITGQLTYFNNSSRNFYAGGRNEVFLQLGRINVEGLEMAIGADVFSAEKQRMRFFGNLTLLKSKVRSGRLEDRDLFAQVVHSTATRNEYISKVNGNREAFEVYVSDGAGGEVLFNQPTLQTNDFENITRSVIHFGEGGITDAAAPYTPSLNVSGGVEYNWKDLTVGLSGHYVGEQFTEFHNFVAESADGAIGELPDYFTMDAFVNYDFKLGDQVRMNAFINGKNITNKVYRASRLNRATSGVFPGGFSQWIFGVDINI